MKQVKPRTAYPFSKNDFSDPQKVELIEAYTTEILKTLGLDLRDDSLKDTPKRIAKMFVNEVFSGLNEANYPKITLQENKMNCGMIKVLDIDMKSYCEHHFVPFFGKCHVGYLPHMKIIGLSKINRIVEYYARRPQVQERLTSMIKEELQEILQTEDVIVVIQAKHLCVRIRGVEDHSSFTETESKGGKFADGASVHYISFLDSIGRVDME